MLRFPTLFSLAGQVKRVLVLHDFDISGFSIAGTFGKTNRRYRFANTAQVMDIGLRLADVEEMGLESEPVVVSGDWAKRAATLRSHGATADEIAFLRTRRVELNAMSSQQMIDFIEAKFTEHGVTKLVPEAAVLEAQARYTFERLLLKREIDKIAPKIRDIAARKSLPRNLEAEVEELLADQPSVSWDQAVAAIAERNLKR